MSATLTEPKLQPGADSDSGLSTEGSFNLSDLTAQLEHAFMGEDEPETPADPSPAPTAPKPADPPADPQAADSDDDLQPLLGDDDAADSDDLDDDEDADPAADPQDDHPDAKAPKWVQKRIDRLTAQKRELKEEAAAAKATAAALEARVKSLEANLVVAQPTADDPLADVLDTATLDTTIRQAKAVRAWCIENPDGGAIPDGKGGEVEYDAREVARRRAAAEDILGEHAPARRTWITERQTADERARKLYPALYKDGTEERKAYEEILRRTPSLARDPYAPLRAGRELLGFLIESGRYKAIPVKAAAAADAKPATPAPRPPAAPKPSASPRPGPDAAIAAKRQRAFDTGNVGDLAEALESMI